MLRLLGRGVRLRPPLRGILLLGLRLLVKPLPRALLALMAGPVPRLLVLDPVRSLGLWRSPVRGVLRRRGVGRCVG